MYSKSQYISLLEITDISDRVFLTPKISQRILPDTFRAAVLFLYNSRLFLVVHRLLLSLVTTIDIVMITAA